MKTWKKALALILVLALGAGLLAGCGSSEKPAASDGGDGKVYKVAMVNDSPISDGGWGASCYNAMMDAAEAMGWETAYTDEIDVSGFADAITSYCDLGYDLIYLAGNQFQDACISVAPNYPDVNFAILNGDESVLADNVTSMLPDARQIGLIAGLLAGIMSETEVIGFVGGYEIDTTKTKLEYMEKGAQYINPNIKCLSAYAGSFSDTAKGMELGNNMIAEGADFFYGDASSIDSGVRQAIDAANTSSGSIKIYDVAQPSDSLGQNPCIICSACTDNSAMIKACMEDIEAGTFGGKTIYGNLANGGLWAGEMNTELMTQEQQDQYMDLIEQLKNDELPID